MSTPPPHLQRSLPQPETMTRSIRKFAVEPIETTRSTKAPLDNGATTDKQPIARFALQLEESSIRKSRKGIGEAAENISTPQSSSSSGSFTPPRATRYVPQLIETSKRSRKKGETISPMLHIDKTDLSPGDNVYLPRHYRVTRTPLLMTPEHTRLTAKEGVPWILESRFSSSALSRHAPRRTSFRIPHLEPIVSLPDSEESNESNCPSLSTSPSAASYQNDINQTRESCDDRFSGYLLELAAQATENQLKDQAMAAYINETMHEPVDHFAIDRESDGSDDELGFNKRSRDDTRDAQMFTCESTTGWHVSELRRHKDILEQQRRQSRAAEQVNKHSKVSAQVPVESEGYLASDALEAPQNIIGGWQKGVGLNCMRTAASPRMLGNSLIFPKCTSPRQTRFDVTQRPYPRVNITTISRPHSGLWLNSELQNCQNSGGLWNGYCAARENDARSVSETPQAGLKTPRTEHNDLISPDPLHSVHHLSTLPATSGEAVDIDGLLTKEQFIDDKVSDPFVTQIYNYLSLGYPSLARKFDGELSKISKMTIEDIRCDDERRNAKGYSGTPEGIGPKGEEIKKSPRWIALRLYIMEWERQQPWMAERDADEWGGEVLRRGSWAL